MNTLNLLLILAISAYAMRDFNQLSLGPTFLQTDDDTELITNNEGESIQEAHEEAGQPLQYYANSNKPDMKNSGRDRNAALKEEGAEGFLSGERERDSEPRENQISSLKNTKEFIMKEFSEQDESHEELTEEEYETFHWEDIAHDLGWAKAKMPQDQLLASGQAEIIMDERQAEEAIEDAAGEDERDAAYSAAVKADQLEAAEEESTEEATEPNLDVSQLDDETLDYMSAEIEEQQWAAENLSDEEFDKYMEQDNLED